jgi:hypothetical protein
MPFPNQADDLIRARMASKGALGKHERPVDGHLERASRGLDQAYDGLREGLLQLGRQTGGPRLVVSHYAVFDRDLHWRWLLGFRIRVRC